VAPEQAGDNKTIPAVVTFAGNNQHTFLRGLGKTI
jgi:hypothetical protein